MDKQQMKTYELTFITKSDSKDTLSSVEDFIKKYEGKVNKQTPLGKRKFAYMIKKNREGNYFKWLIELPKNQVLPFKKGLSQNEIVLRYLLLSINN